MRCGAVRNGAVCDAMHCTALQCNAMQGGEFWKWLAVPGGLYALERILRHVRGMQVCTHSLASLVVAAACTVAHD